MNESGRAEREIEELLGERTGRECLYVPSCRLGIYIALVASLEPGDRILMSPANDDVILFVVLAAGIRPVMAPISPRNGNIDPDAIPDDQWRSVRAVMTTNLYGLPDRMPELRARCDALGLLLIEDAAHALHTETAGRPIGCFGELSVFSLSKHAAGVGGVVAIADPGRRGELIALRDRFVEPRSLRVRGSDSLRPRASRLVERLHLRRALRSASRTIGAAERRAHRMPLALTQLRTAGAAPALDGFDRWVRVDKHDYRLDQRPELLALTAAWLRAAEGDREARIAGTSRLRELTAAAPALRDAEPQAFYRVPLLVDDREAAGASLEAAGHPLEYVYDPPLDDYAGDEFVDPSPAPDAARWWVTHALPVDPLLADTALAALAGPGLLSPPHRTV